MLRLMANPYALVPGETGPDGQPLKPGEMSEAEAQRVLEGVKEGRPRVVIPGRSEGKPW